VSGDGVLPADCTYCTVCKTGRTVGRSDVQLLE